MTFAYFTPDEIRTIHRIVTDAVGNYLGARSGILATLPNQFLGRLNQLTQSNLQLADDLRILNGTERLRDGTVPFEEWFRQLLMLYGFSDGVDKLRPYLDKVVHRATGIPDIEPPRESETKEAIVHQDDTLPLSFMRRGLAAAAAVAKITVPRFEGTEEKRASDEPVFFLGTGWLIARGFLITNHHVFNARLKGEQPASPEEFTAQARNATVLFDYDEDGVAGRPCRVTSVIGADPGLDYALVAIEDDGRAPLTCNHALPSAPSGHGAAAVNIIQHPSGKPKMVAVRNNLIAGRNGNDLRYFTDTNGGSSGSPVMDDDWRVVALHRGSTYAGGVTFQGKATAYLNVGTCISAIVHHLHAHYPEALAAFDL